MSSDFGNIEIGPVATQPRIAAGRRAPNSQQDLAAQTRLIQLALSNPRPNFSADDFLRNLRETSFSALHQVPQSSYSTATGHLLRDGNDEINEKLAHRAQSSHLATSPRKRRSPPHLYSPSKRARLALDWSNDTLYAHNFHQNSFRNPPMPLPSIFPRGSPWNPQVPNQEFFGSLQNSYGLHLTSPTSEASTSAEYSAVPLVSTTMSQPSTSSIPQPHVLSFGPSLQPTTSSVTNHFTTPVCQVASSILRQAGASSSSHLPTSCASSPSVSISSLSSGPSNAQLSSSSSNRSCDISNLPPLASIESQIPTSTAYRDSISVETPFPTLTESGQVKLEPMNEDSEKISDSLRPLPDSLNDDLENKASSPHSEEDDSLHSVDFRSEAHGCIQVKKQQDLCNPTEVSDDAADEPLSPNEQLNENSNDSHTLSPKYRNSDDVENVNSANETGEADFKEPSQLTCSLCEFSTDEAQAYSEHVQVVHSNVCFDCKFVAENSSQLFEHRQVCVANNMGSTSASTKPKTKSKKLVCKVCKDEASDEKEFYNHRRTHISPDKILECKFCPFVTQYKHHLDYHMKNHTGNKPFKCQQCEYSCVNKSMLNSHMKSHSNFYSYRCKDCNYEAKYMHALKCHCRKYRHDAMPVLNPDGTINPFPIVDVYGTRRGPKVKRDADGNIVMPAQYTAKIAMQPTKKDPIFSSVAGGTMNTTTISPPSLTFSSASFHQRNASPNPLFNPYSGISSRLFHSSNPVFNTQPPPSLIPNTSYLNSPQSPSTSSQRHFLESLSKTLPHADSKVCHYCDQSFHSDPLLQQHLLLAHILPRNSLVQDAGTPPRAPPRNESQSDTHNAAFLTKILAASIASSAMQPISLLPPFRDSPQDRDDPSDMNTMERGLSNSSPTPLDLTKDHTPPQQIMRRCLSQSPPDVAATSLTPPDTCSPPKKLRRSDHLSLTNRRLENIKEEPSTNNCVSVEQSSSSSLNSVASREEVVVVKTEASENEINASEKSPQKESSCEGLECTICNITFRVESMFKKHIAFHDEEEPLRCSFCKDVLADSTVFFEHCFNCKQRYSHTEKVLT